MSYCRLLLTPRMTLLIVIGSLIYSVGLNQFIVPVGLYNGGFLGIALRYWCRDDFAFWRQRRR